MQFRKQQLELDMEQQTGSTFLGRASPAQGLPLDTAGGGHERGGVSWRRVGGESSEAKGGGEADMDQNLPALI